MAMKPVAIFRHSPQIGTGHFSTFLQANHIPYQLFFIDQGEPVPNDPTQFSGLGFMGGIMSVNDPLPWIPAVLELIRAAVKQDIPVIGHCLGGQLMSKALGGSVSVNPVKEIGWLPIYAEDHALAKAWLGTEHELPVFQWHGDTFTIPPDATRIATSPVCRNQMFVMGKHLGMQCHIEMTQEMVESWCETGTEEIEASKAPSVQTTEEMMRNREERVAGLNKLAEGVYRRWIQGL